MKILLAVNCWVTAEVIQNQEAIGTHSISAGDLFRVDSEDENGILLCPLSDWGTYLHIDREDARGNFLVLEGKLLE